jgi:hypothetical protein
MRWRETDLRHKYLKRCRLALEAVARGDMTDAQFRAIRLDAEKELDGPQMNLFREETADEKT